MSASGEQDGTGHGVFATTHWSVVLAARQQDGTAAERALEALCRSYWPPLYAYIRRAGYDAHAAQDLTQEFLSRLVHRDWLGHLQDQRGKFRSFLLTFLKRFLSDQRDHDRAAKRGGGAPFLSLDAFAEEERSHWEPVTGLSADQLYEQRWARVVMETAARRLREDYLRRDRAAWYDELKDLQPGEHGTRSYADIAAHLLTTEQAVKNAVHSFRRRYGELLRQEIAQTVADPAEIEAEIQHLLRVFAR